MAASRVSPTWILAIALASIEAPAPPALAGTLSINPTTILLTSRIRSTLLTLRNDGEEQARFQVTVFDWNQDPQGQMALRPSEDIVCFPSVLTIDPGQVRNIRIGAPGGFADRERSYRIFLEEIPASHDPAAGVQVLTRLGVPVFLEPEAPRSGAAIENLTLGREGLSFALRNPGHVHFIPDSVMVQGSDAAGQPVVAEELESWYVLAAGVRQFLLPIDPEKCSRLRHVSVEARVGQATLTARLETPSAACSDAP
jgi:fimbrial chaperone protein